MTKTRLELLKNRLEAWKDERDSPRKAFKPETIEAVIKSLEEEISSVQQVTDKE